MDEPSTMDARRAAIEMRRTADELERNGMPREVIDGNRRIANLLDQGADTEAELERLRKENKELNRIFETTRRKFGVKCMSDVPDERDVELKRLRECLFQIRYTSEHAGNHGEGSLERALLSIQELAQEPQEASDGN